MRFVFNESGGIDIFVDNSAEQVALLMWESRFPVRTVHEGTEQPMKMRPAEAITLKDVHEFR